MTFGLKSESTCFSKNRKTAELRTRQNAISQLVLGVAFDQACRLTGGSRAKLLHRLDRIIERERLKGARKHWSYDLNRHIALKQLRDGLIRVSSSK